ncbi:hypothetical protein LTR78_007015 [Recurvomyces mirabilis]|uniref:Uncharacterized protein n=1 Tax=Recurvomyces mirabilis TaxID=574656 RepID=A0AAE1BZ40_9PEZI|nr:hypothetical protein LTR78_007015 [Recurvomyces mirabilis]KAK5153399.1 hypothetical protein LTS14_007568 [Recurvomyces mirabilis]
MRGSSQKLCDVGDGVRAHLGCDGEKLGNDAVGDAGGEEKRAGKWVAMAKELKQCFEIVEVFDGARKVWGEEIYNGLFRRADREASVAGIRNPFDKEQEILAQRLDDLSKEVDSVVASADEVVRATDQRYAFIEEEIFLLGEAVSQQRLILEELAGLALSADLSTIYYSTLTTKFAEVEARLAEFEAMQPTVTSLPQPSGTMMDLLRACKPDHTDSELEDLVLDFLAGASGHGAGT